MATGKVTTAVDIIQAKTPASLIVAFVQGGGDAAALNISTKLPQHYITKQMYLDNLPVPVIVQAIRLNFALGTALPLLFPNFQTGYAQLGSTPKIKCRKITGGGWLTASIIHPGTTASNGTYTAQALVDSSGVYSPNGIGTGGTATVVVSGGVVTGITKVNGGSLYNIGDLFTIAAIPGGIFQIATGGEFFYQDLTSSATILIGEITDGLPDNISVNVDDDGTLHLEDAMQIILSN
jgi:hypothetical protein